MELTMLPSEIRVAISNFIEEELIEEGRLIWVQKMHDVNTNFEAAKDDWFTNILLYHGSNIIQFILSSVPLKGKFRTRQYDREYKIKLFLANSDGLNIHRHIKDYYGIERFPKYKDTWQTEYA